MEYNSGECGLVGRWNAMKWSGCYNSEKEDEVVEGNHSTTIIDTCIHLHTWLDLTYPAPPRPKGRSKILRGARLMLIYLFRFISLWLEEQCLWLFVYLFVCHPNSNDQSI